ncbi:uncharacterized protein BJ171DRAFT_489186 [Polychytrium aggregatum]|uniref:uncharacterized protein n=1 Tax=Polychytrium aggregatum TaxID=110093 RepID=UPI0022FE2290|nr:uncharacterized protein BJ171DRAFT_489186 [Polychytrium aggregatum]KAI9208525.1 hypothetical protein BJ171DRAFT_489186 [Polychytrium aggregatum]
MSQQICKFFNSPGGCRFGSRCRNKHTSPAPNSQGFGGGSSNRFGALQSTTTSINGETIDFAKVNDELFNRQTSDNPSKTWIFSCYGPLKDQPSLLSGTDWSPEEARWEYEAERRATGGQVSQYLQGIAQRTAYLEQSIQQIVSNPQQALEVFKSQVSPAPKGSSAFGKPPGAGVFGNNPSGANAFGQKSGFAQPSVFGQASTPSSGSAFGQVSAFGQAGALGQNSAFGQKSAFGGGLGSTGVFGQKSGLGQNSAFGQKSALGQTNAFAQAGAPSVTNAFGQPSGLGQPSAFGQTSTFGQTSNIGQASAFGQPSALGAANASAPGSAFAKTSAFGQFGTAPAFGQSGSTFGAVPATGTSGPPSAFGQPSGGAFGSTAAPALPRSEAIALPAELTPEAEAAFRSNQFQFGLIPEFEPPPQLRRI